jgi:hypothetical protein
MLQVVGLDESKILSLFKYTVESVTKNNEDVLDSTSVM